MSVRALLLLSDWSIGHEVNLAQPTGCCLMYYCTRRGVYISRPLKIVVSPQSIKNPILPLASWNASSLSCRHANAHQVSAVAVSPFDSVSFLRAAIQADIVRDASSVTTTTVNNAGYRQGHCDSGSGGGRGGCPPFAFSYADGVAVDRGQEERLSVKDIAVTSSVASSASSAVGEATYDHRWGEDSASEQSGHKELRVFLRACEPRTQQPTADHGTSGVLHRWEDLQGTSWGDEVNQVSSCFHFVQAMEGQTSCRCVVISSAPDLGCRKRRI